MNKVQRQVFLFYKRNQNKNQMKYILYKILLLRNAFARYLRKKNICENKYEALAVLLLGKLHEWGSNRKNNLSYLSLLKIHYV